MEIEVKKPVENPKPVEKVEKTPELVNIIKLS